MPWKYLRMTRRRTCDTPHSEEEENMISSGSNRTAAFFCAEKPLP